jgi:hypothetical protein
MGLEERDNKEPNQGYFSVRIKLKHLYRFNK